MTERIMAVGLFVGLAASIGAAVATGDPYFALRVLAGVAVGLTGGLLLLAWLASRREKKQ